LSVGELRRLDDRHDLDAMMLAGILEATMNAGISAPSLTLKPGEEKAAGEALERLTVKLRPLPAELKCLRHGIRLEVPDAEGGTS
jgi:hypothetical protein